MRERERERDYRSHGGGSEEEFGATFIDDFQNLGDLRKSEVKEKT
jgi:hypothetical protein